MKLPTIEQVDGGVRVTVWRRDATTTQATTQSLSEVQKSIITIIKENPSISRKELSSKIGNITEDGIKYHIQKLQKMGVLRREGPDFGGKWVVLLK